MREDHVKLRVGGKCRVSGCYVHCLTNLCKETNTFTEVNGGKWFCANGGICDDSDA